MQRIARLSVVMLVVVATMLSSIPVRAQGTITVSVDVFLSGDMLTTGCKPPTSIGAAVVRIGASTMVLKDGVFKGLSASPTNRNGCLYSTTMSVLEAKEYAVSVGDIDVGVVSASEMRALDNYVQVAISTPDLTVESVNWRFPNEDAVGARPQPTPTAPSSHQTTTSRRPTPTPASSRSSDRWGCSDLADYQGEMFALLLQVDEYDAVARLMDADDFTSLRPSVLRRASDGLDQWAGMLEEMDDVPPGAEEYHVAFVNLIGLMASVTIALANGGTFAVIPYTDAMDAATADLNSASRLGERRCGAEWIDVFGS